MFQETDKKFRKNDDEFKDLKESIKEAGRIREEDYKRWWENNEKLNAQLNAQMKETDRKISKLGSRIGELVEQLTASNILEKFRMLDYNFSRVSRNHSIEDEQGRCLAEIDLLLENGDCAMVVEVKSLLTIPDVKEHQKRLKTLRIYADNRRDDRIYAGAVAGALFSKNARSYALENGMYVIEQSGDTVQIKAPEKPYYW
jgi:hypothetical protein